MEPQAAQDECSRLLSRRSERHRNGGVGLLMGSELARSDAVDRLARRSRGLAVAIAAGMLGLFAAGGFASAKMWDGHGSKHLKLSEAIEAARSAEADDLRNNGITSTLGFAWEAVTALVELRSDPVVGSAARAYVDRLRELLPEPASTAAAIQNALDGRLAVAEREESLRHVKIAAREALRALRAAAVDPGMATAAAGYLSELDKMIDRPLAESR